MKESLLEEAGLSRQVSRFPFLSPLPVHAIHPEFRHCRIIQPPLTADMSLLMRWSASPPVASKINFSTLKLLFGRYFVTAVRNVTNIHPVQIHILSIKSTFFHNFVSSSFEGENPPCLFFFSCTQSVYHFKT